MTTPAWGQPPQQKPTVSKGMKGCLGCGGLFAVLLVIGAIANAVKPATTHPAAVAASSTIAASPTAAATSSKPTVHITAHTITSASSSAPSSPTPKAPRSTPASCEPTRDILVWTKAPGLPDSAQELGNYNLQNCEPTMQWLQQTSPTDAGYCTEAAWASDNPGYNADASPAAPLKKVQMMIGPAC